MQIFAINNTQANVCKDLGNVLNVVKPGIWPENVGRLKKELSNVISAVSSGIYLLIV